MFDHEERDSNTLLHSLFTILEHSVNRINPSQVVLQSVVILPSHGVLAQPFTPLTITLLVFYVQLMCKCV